jgi:AraC family transcriptional activator FtrA
VRLDRAKQMLEVGGLGIEDVAMRAGFGTSATLRMHFRSAVGISPREYRRQFGHEREPGASISLRV